MQVIRASELFKSIKSIDNNDFEKIDIYDNVKGYIVYRIKKRI